MSYLVIIQCRQVISRKKKEKKNAGELNLVVPWILGAHT